MSMTIEDVLFFDTETTGIPERSARWDVDFMGYPHVVQMAWMHGGIVENHIIRPDGWEIPEETVKIHGITTEYALEHGEPFAAVAEMFIEDCHDAGLICGHNIHFDTGIVKANILRELGREYYDASDVDAALYKGKRIDTMRSSMKWVDARNSWGSLKFPNLGELYSRCFPGETFPAHDALEDVKAVARCLPVIVDLGLVELKVREYPETEAIPKAIFKLYPEKNDASFSETAKNGSILKENQKDDKLLIPQEKTPQNANSTKLTDAVSALLEENDF